MAKIQKKTRDTAKKTCSKRQKVNKALNQKMTVIKVVQNFKNYVTNFSFQQNLKNEDFRANWKKLLLKGSKGGK